MRTLIHHLIEQQARSRGDTPALTFKKTSLTYGELWRDLHDVAGGLLTLGLRRDDRVGVYLDKRLETVTSIFGTSLAGGVFVPINPLLRPRQVAYILGDCDVRVVITSTDRLATLADELRGTPSVEHVVLVDGAPDASMDRTPYKVTTWAELTGASTDMPENRGIDLDMAAILYTSGSTGNPKGVVLCHRNLIVGAESVSSYLGNTADDVILSALPLSFDAGFSQLTTAFSVGAHVVLMNYLLPADVVRLCAKHRVTGLTCVPPLWIQIAERTWPTEAAQHLRYFANTGGRMPKATLDALRAHFPHAKPYLMYGLTEAFRSTFLDPEQVDRRPDSIGKAIPNAEILVVRPDGTACEPGEEGELVHRGALVALGYWNDPERTVLRFKPVPGPLSAWRACARDRGVVRRHGRQGRGRLSVLRRSQRRDDQDLWLPHQPHGDRRGRVQHRFHPRCGGLRSAGWQTRSTHRPHRHPPGPRNPGHRRVPRRAASPTALVHGARNGRGP